MFASKPGAYPRVEQLKCAQPGCGLAWPERIAWDKHSSLLQTFVNYGHKSFITLGSAINITNIFMDENFDWAKYAKALVPRMAFKPSLMFASKARVYLSGETYSRLLAFASNIRLGWKCLPGTNTLAYSVHL